MVKVKRKLFKTKYRPACMLFKYLRDENLKFKLQLKFRYIKHFFI